ncbi:quinol:cytochrome C oxidoreductase [Hymenobacter psoromatis]|nr:quinol:cytochrome C oxidoreductase [Hymenobacter psoromatis]
MTSPAITAAPVATVSAPTTSTKRFALGVFEDEEVLLHAVDNVRAAGVKIYEVFSPFPIHGIDDALGIERSRLPIAAFFYGLCGLSFALWMQIYMLGFDWPMIIGGKPAISLPAWIPVSFELTVFFTCHGMVITFYTISKLYPRFKTPMLDVRSTDDKFVMAIELDENSSQLPKLTQLLRENGASEVNQKEMTKF